MISLNFHFSKSAKDPLYRPNMALFRPRKTTKDGCIEWSYTKSEKVKMTIGILPTNPVSIFFFFHLRHKKIRKIYNILVGIFWDLKKNVFWGCYWPKLVFFNQIDDNVSWPPRSNDHFGMLEHPLNPITAPYCHSPSEYLRTLPSSNNHSDVTSRSWALQLKKCCLPKVDHSTIIRKTYLGKFLCG